MRFLSDEDGCSERRRKNSANAGRPQMGILPHNGGSAYILLKLYSILLNTSGTYNGC